MAQAKDYAGKLQLRFSYASNGKGISAIDMDSGEEGEADSFPSPQELWQLADPLLPGDRREPGAGGNRRRPQPHPSDALEKKPWHGSNPLNCVNRPGAQQRQGVPHNLPDLHERPAGGWQAISLVWPIPARLL